MYYPWMHEIHTEILGCKKVILIKYNNALDIVKVEFNNFLQNKEVTQMKSRVKY